MRSVVNLQQSLKKIFRHKGVGLPGEGETMRVAGMDGPLSVLLSPTVCGRLHLPSRPIRAGRDQSHTAAFTFQ